MGVNSHIKSSTLCMFLGVLFRVPGVSSQDDVFTVHPQDQTVISGKPATLTCNVTNLQTLMVHWTLNGNPVENNTRRFQESTNLHITRVDRVQDLGDFRCVATDVDNGTSVRSRPAQMDVQWIGDKAKVQLHSPKTPEELFIGGDMVLRCKADGNPEITYQWFHNGNRLFRNERVSFRNKRLHINNLNVADNGIFSCRGVNDAGTVDSAENFPVILQSEKTARIIELPQDIIVKDGDSGMFNCVYRNAAAVEWYAPKEDVPLNNGSRHTIFLNGSLLISHVQYKDQGIYRCVGISASKDIPQQTYIAHLKLAYLEELSESSFEPLLDENQRVFFPLHGLFEVACLAPAGFPPPRIWWEDPKGHILSDSGRIRVEDGRLIINDVKQIDSGSFTCVAENLAGEKRKKIELFVTIPPVITSNPVDIQIDEGKSTTFSCKYKGSPYPIASVHWLKNDQYVNPSDPHITVYENKGTLVIQDVQLSDAGTYRCVVNTSGFPPVFSENSTLAVKETLKFVPPPVSKKLELGSKGKIYCKARGAKIPTVHWVKNSAPSNHWPPHIKDENGTLHFNVVQPEDAGSYTCIATSPQETINATINVEVVVMPRFTVTPADTEAYEGYPVMLHCKAKGDPQPSIQWDKDNVLKGFDKNRFQVLNNGTLYIKEAHMNDKGKYGCTAGNSGGFRRAEVLLVVRSTENYSPNQISEEDQDDASTMSKTVTITLCAAVIYIVLVIGLMIWCRIRRARRKAMLLAQASEEVAKPDDDDDAQGDTEMKDRVNLGAGDQERVNGVGKNEGVVNAPGSSSQPANRSSYDNFQFSRNNLQTMMLLGHGKFGEVFLAKARDINDHKTETVVMVKALQTKDEDIHSEYKKETEMFRNLSHKNWTKLLGQCLDVEPFLMVLEYSDWGDLKQFLLATRKENSRKGPKPPPLSTSQVIGVCHQVATGMEYFSSQQLIHKDLATRNCLITSRLDIKISNPGLFEDTYAQEYSRYQNKVVPLRWAAPEAVLEDNWSTKSDVWSFAVLVWEVFTQADFPFATKTDDVILQLLKNHQLVWSQPEASPKLLTEMLQGCWNYHPVARPSFSEITTRIGEINVVSNV
ncbi:inactive tyrosine-protein kinase 7-like [Limulus polyphemus]|uniref:Inactive tyrosine-protein kinase 7-like n=1 Tax=Limulus polyphemus TaxID=6850 RepID=A0ABM1C4C3_LIMPO|nr:inactive tyrosine-protein kinase 7-like [Limulus polyphemus]